MTTIRAKKVSNSPVSAITQTPASEPFLLVTAPLIASAAASVVSGFGSASAMPAVVVAERFSSEHPMSSSKGRMHVKGLRNFDSISLFLQ